VLAYRIHALLNGRCAVAGDHALNDGDPNEIWPFVLYVWLIEGADRPILVDAGLTNVDEMNNGAAHVMAEPITQAPEETSTAQLAKRGIKPEDVGHVIVTHLHFDHVDDLENYSNAKYVVSRRGLEAALRVRAQGDPGWAPWKTLDLLEGPARDRTLAVDDAEIVPGVRTMWFGGHSRCSQGVAVDTADGVAVIGGDTICLYEHFEQRRAIGIIEDLAEGLAAVDRAREVADIILPGHDPRVLERHPGGVIG
jgi:glyoxylase-like metal-dependent hydrolase (beta-lactamase superfamily II)